jgi:hypothetical protein
VAIIALLGRLQMVLRFAYGYYAVVAFTAIPKDFLMIDSRYRGKISISMAGLTAIAGRDVIRRFADCYDTIVTGCAVVDDATMVEERACEAGGAMTDDAILGCWNMRYRLTPGSGCGVVAIVAGDAVFAESLVIDHTAGKAGSGMAEVATQGGGYMPLRFTGC